MGLLSSVSASNAEITGRREPLLPGETFSGVHMVRNKTSLWDCPLPWICVSPGSPSGLWNDKCPTAGVAPSQTPLLLCRLFGAIPFLLLAPSPLIKTVSLVSQRCLSLPGARIIGWSPRPSLNNTSLNT